MQEQKIDETVPMSEEQVERVLVSLCREPFDLTHHGALLTAEQSRVIEDHTGEYFSMTLALPGSMVRLRWHDGAYLVVLQSEGSDCQRLLAVVRSPDEAHRQLEKLLVQAWTHHWRVPFAIEHDWSMDDGGAQ